VKLNLRTADLMVLGGLVGDDGGTSIVRHSPSSLYADLNHGTRSQIKESLERLRGYGLVEYFVPLVSNDGKDWRITDKGLVALTQSRRLGTVDLPDEPAVLTSPETRILKWLREWAAKDDDWVTADRLRDELCLTSETTLEALYMLVNRAMVDYAHEGGVEIWRINDMGVDAIADRPDNPVATLGLGYTGDELDTFTAPGVDVKLENMGDRAELTVTSPDGTVWSFEMGEAQSTFFLDWSVTRPKKKRRD